MCAGEASGAELGVTRSPHRSLPAAVCDIYLLKDFGNNWVPSKYGGGKGRGQNTSYDFKKHVGFLPTPLGCDTVGSNTISHQQIFLARMSSDVTLSSLYFFFKAVALGRNVFLRPCVHCPVNVTCLGMYWFLLELLGDLLWCDDYCFLLRQTWMAYYIFKQLSVCGQVCDS